jgi:hypothetical protein
MFRNRTESPTWIVRFAGWNVLDTRRTSWVSANEGPAATARSAKNQAIREGRQLLDVLERGAEGGSVGW